MKKILSLVLVLALVLGSFSFAFAAAPADVVDTDYEEAVETLMALGIVNGYPDGTYRPANVVTRAEMAKLLIVALGYEELSGGAASFSDTAGHWAEGYIALATGLGIVQGYPDGTFKPDATVSFDEAVTMILRALGYTDDSLTGAWPTNYKIKALNLDLLDGVTITAAGADRGAVALMLFNALEQKYGQVDADDVWITSGNTLLSLLSKMGNFVEGYTFTYADIYDEDDALDTAIDLTDYLFFNVDYYENADEEIAYISEVNSETIVGDATTASGFDLSVIDADDEPYDVDTSGASMYFNWDQTSNYTNFDGAEVTVVWLDTDDDGDFDSDEVLGVIGNKVTDVFVADEDAYDDDDFVVEAKDGNDLDLPTTEDDDDETVLDTDNVVVIGAVDSLEEIEEYDVVEVWEADANSVVMEDTFEKVTLNVIRDVVEGLYSEYDDDGSIIVVDGEALDLSGDWEILGDVTVSDTDELGSDVMALLDSYGEVVAVYMVEEAEATDFYAVVTGAIDQTTGGDFEDEVVLGQVRLLVESGDQIIYDVVEDMDYATTLATTFLDDALVIFTLNSDGEIDSLTHAALDYTTSTAWEYNEDLNYVSYDSDDFFLADDVLIFDLTEDTEDYAVIAPADLGDNLTSGAIVDADSEEVTVMVLTESDADVEKDTVFAVIVDVTVVLDPDDSDYLALKVKALVDGELTTLYTEEGDTDLLSSSHEDDFAELSLEDGRIADATTDSVFCATTVQAVGANYIKVDGVVELVADDVVVYVVTLDDGDIDTIEAGTMADVEVDSFIDWSISADTMDDDEVTVIFVCEEDM